MRTANWSKALSENTLPDFWPAVQTMIDADIGSRAEFALRYFVVASGAVFMTIASERIEIAIWLSGFLCTNGYYSWWLSKIQAPVSGYQYFGLVSLLIISVTLYTSCAVYLFLIGSPEFITISIAALVAQSLFNLSRHRESNLIVVYDTAIVVAAGLFVGLSSLKFVSSAIAEQLVIIVSTSGVCAYYVIAQVRKIQTHRALKESRLAAVQTQKMRAVGQLTSGVAHEFNNLLLVIRGNIELALLPEVQDEYVDRLKDAIVAVDRATAITSQLLSFSRKAQLKAETVDVEKCFSGLDKMIPRLVPATMRFHINRSLSAEFVYCDKNQLDSALMNLVINACDATSQEGNIWVSAQVADAALAKDLEISIREPENLVVIQVTDDGPGIPHSILDKVVEPFFTTKSVGEGTGLGLPMVKGFCEQSDGWFAIKSDPKGTSVFMVLPAAQNR